jgi:hypothetical protein
LELESPKHSLGIPWAFPGHSLGIPWAFPGHSLGIPWAFPGHYLVKKNYIPATNPQLTVKKFNLIFTCVGKYCHMGLAFALLLL